MKIIDERDYCYISALYTNCTVFFFDAFNKKDSNVAELIGGKKTNRRRHQLTIHFCIVFIQKT